MKTDTDAERHMGLLGATSVGVGAIVGGGILALAGAAFAATGPSAIVAFALNGLIALLTALSFAEVSSKFPQSGGTYTFAKKVLSVEAAFIVGWVVWFASIVAAVLYALGFGQFAAIAIADIWQATRGNSPAWLTEQPFVRGLAIAATLLYTISLMTKSSGGGPWANIGKVVVFGVLIVCGLWVMRGRTTAELSQSLRPFFAEGAAGLFQAMGFTFIALQGFDLIAAVAGEIRQPERTIPRAMLGSLGIALLIYLPLLLVISTVGVAPGESITEASRADAEKIVAIAAQRYLGPFGYWLVIVAAILSMLSALQANLFAASRVAMAMARDRTLPRRLARIHARFKTPVQAVAVTAFLIVAIVLALPSLAAAGAASSLIFLITFALAHWIAVLVRQRSRSHPPPFRSPLYPLIPVVGGVSCLALAIYQGVAVPSAGGITIAWLVAGGLLFLVLFARRARIADATSSAFDPELVRMRGRNPLVLVPIANPDNARALVIVANALAPPTGGRVLLLSVVVAPSAWQPREDRTPLEKAQRVLGEAITASMESGLSPESLTTVAPQPWQEIARVAKTHRCESLLLGLSQLSDEDAEAPLDAALSRVACDIVVLRAPQDWQLTAARRILIPTAGRGGHDRLLARLLASIARSDQREVTLLRVMPRRSTTKELRRAEQMLQRTAQDLSFCEPRVLVTVSDSPVDEITAQAANADLMIVGMHRVRRRQKLFGQFVLQVARRTNCPLLLISSRQ